MTERNRWLMGSKIKHFADDGWAVWIDGDEKSTVYFNEWINPSGKNYVDIGVRMYEAENAREVNIYIPFEIEENEIDGLGLSAIRDALSAVDFSFSDASLM